ncbi:MAG: Co2+/Mg2+ efflux protein ApaG [Gammaproteobacteria bacterium RIFCSPHIGHO2_12_FULL_37_14]|nr:MAG: Co2+/Mg2+ efflux protein ApaG [Gammaproteobacteria bacterium RIFCSPHIGHO2_12_FULL_37_14]
MKNIEKIIVTAHPSYIQAQSDPLHQKFVWSYEITIVNDSDQIVHLLSRYWRITDMTGKIEEVHGAGVVGLQPLIKPGKKFSYTSYCQLVSPQGTMEGHYEVQNIEEEHFRVVIPKFILSAPSSITKSYRSKLH